MKKHLYLFGLLLFIFSCSPINKILEGGNLKETSFTERIPFNFEFGVPIIKVNIEGKNYNFLFDTGAPTVISPNLATELNLKTAAKAKTTDSQGNSNPQNFVSIPNIKIGNLNFENIGAVVIDMKQVFEFKCMNFDGIIGANQMEKAIWEIDYKTKMLTVSNDLSAFNIPSTAEVLNFKAKQAQKTPIVEVKIGNKIANVTFDTGATTDFNLPFETYQSEISTFKGVEAMGNSSSGIYGTSKSSTTTYKKIPYFTISDMPLKDQIVTFSEGPSSIIGNTLFKNYRLILNWKEHKIYMIKVNDSKNTKYESFGIGLRYINNKPTVAKIFKNTAAEKSGLLINDQIIALDGKNTSNFTEAEACFNSFNSLLTGKNTISITILREGQQLDFQLKKETILE
jgi:hypothetical protein